MKITIHAKDLPAGLRTTHMVEKIKIDSDVHGKFTVRPKHPEMDSFDLEIALDQLTKKESFELSYQCDSVERIFEESKS